MAIGLRQILTKRTSLLIRNIMTTPSKSEKAVEKLQKNPYYEKYADRIASLQKSSPEEFLQRVEQQEKKRQPAPAPVDTRQYSSVLKPKEKLENNVPLEDKKLDAILKMDLVKDKNADEIQTIWETYHRDKEVISAVIPVAQFMALRQRLRRFPSFLFPLPRAQGYEFILCQSLGASLHFTPLLAYQVHKENAPECLTITHYTELTDQGIVLMRGEYDKNVLSGREAQCLANQFQMYYSGHDEAKNKLLETFTERPDTFKHMELVAQLENITLAP